MAFDDVPVVDAWTQHPTAEFLGLDVFESLHRWQGGDGVEAVPVEWTVQAFGNAGVDAALLSAWWGSEGPLLILPAVIT